MEIAAFIVAIIGVSLQAVALGATMKKAVESPRVKSGKITEEIRGLADKTVQTCVGLKERVGHFKRCLQSAGVNLERTTKEIQSDAAWFADKSDRDIRNFDSELSAIRHEVLLLNGDVVSVLKCLGDFETLVRAGSDAERLRNPFFRIDVENMTLREMFDALESALGKLTDYLVPRVQTSP